MGDYGSVGLLLVPVRAIILVYCTSTCTRTRIRYTSIDGRQLSQSQITLDEGAQEDNHAQNDQHG